MPTLYGIHVAMRTRPAVVELRYVLRMCYGWATQGHISTGWEGLLLYHTISRQTAIKQTRPHSIPVYRFRPMKALSKPL